MRVVIPKGYEQAAGRASALLLTGPPGSGKTTVIRKVADALAGRRIAGLVTEEIRVRGERRGFRIASLDGTSAVLAQVGLRSEHHVGRYGVDALALDRVVEAAFPVRGAEIYLIDEIGKMECLSKRFVAAVEAVLCSRAPMAASVAARGAGFIERVKRRREVELWAVRREDRDRLPQRIVDWLLSRRAGPPPPDDSAPPRRRPSPRRTPRRG